MRKLKLYLETSVWSHYYAEDTKEKMEDTRLFFEAISKERYDVFISSAVVGEIDRAEINKRIRLHSLLKIYRPVELEVVPEVYQLSSKYIKSFVLPRNSYDDAFHAAITSVYNLDALISWNCKHLANIIRRNKINSVNLKYGYRQIDIFTPLEVIYSGE
jgi:predicted nucleic acid-binding protein